MNRVVRLVEVSEDIALASDDTKEHLPVMQAVALNPEVEKFNPGVIQT